MNTLAKSIALLSATAISVVAHAGILSYDSSKASLVTSPTSMKYKADSYQTASMQIWNERQSQVLGSSLTVDATSNGTYDAISDLGSYSIAAGTKVDSHYLYFDPLKSASLDTTVTFSGKILGVIVMSDYSSGDRFLASDGLILAAVPSSNIPSSHFDDRGLELRSFNIGSVQDAFTISGNSLTVNLSASTPGDQIRVVTQAVPEPSSVAAVGLGALGLLRRRRK